MLLGILLISRLDHSILPRAFELHDKGFQRYVGFLHTECYHSHPCMHVFLRILHCSCRETKRKFVCSVDEEKTVEVKRAGNYMRNKLLNTLGGSMKASKKNQVSNSPINNSNTDIEKGLQPNLNSGNEKAKTLASAINRNISTPEAVGLADQNIELVRKTSKSVTDEDPNDNLHNAEMEVAAEVEDSWQTMKDSPAVKNHRKIQNARFNWSLFYTLVNNPQLILLRKGYLQQRMKRLKTGHQSKTADEQVDEMVQVENVKIKLGVKKPMQSSDTDEEIL